MVKFKLPKKDGTLLELGLKRGIPLKAISSEGNIMYVKPEGWERNGLTIEGTWGMSIGWQVLRGGWGAKLWDPKRDRVGLI